MLPAYVIIDRGTIMAYLRQARKDYTYYKYYHKSPTAHENAMYYKGLIEAYERILSLTV